MTRLFTLACAIIIVFSACVSKAKQSAKAYEEGIALTKEAAAKSDATAAVELYKKSLEKFKEALKFDSTNQLARTGVGDCYYGSKQYKEAIEAYEQGNKAGESALNFRGIGLSKLALGELTDGQSNLDKAVALNHNKGFIDTLNREVIRLGEESYAMGAAMKATDKETAKKHQSYAMSVLMLAYYYDNSRKDVAEKIAKYADEVGDYTIKVQYSKLSQQ